MEDTLITNDVTNPYLIQTVARAMDILDFVIQRGKEVSVSEVAAALKINSNMAHRLLQTMTATGFLNQSDENSRYTISLKALQLGRVALNSMEVRRRAFPYLETLWRDVGGANANLAVLHGRDVVVIDRIDGGGVPRTFSMPGKTVPLHASAMGKILLCEWPERQVHTLLGVENLPRYTATTIGTRTEFIAELSKVRTELIAWDLSEQLPNNNCVAAPVRDESAKIIASVSLSAFEVNLSRDKLTHAIPRLIEIANSISSVMGFNN